MKRSASRSGIQGCELQADQYLQNEALSVRRDQSSPGRVRGQLIKPGSRIWPQSCPDVLITSPGREPDSLLFNGLFVCLF